MEEGFHPPRTLQIFSKLPEAEKKKRIEARAAAKAASATPRSVNSLQVSEGSAPESNGATSSTVRTVAAASTFQAGRVRGSNTDEFPCI